MSQTARRALAAGLFLLALGCARALASPPPTGQPTASQMVVMPGVPIVVAARAARALEGANFATRRFSADSTWGFRKGDGLSARLRYTSPSSDSTRVLLELWGTCDDRRACLRGDIAGILNALVAEDGPPQ